MSLPWWTALAMAGIVVWKNEESPKRATARSRIPARTQAVGDADRRADGELGVEPIAHRRQAARVADEHRVLPEPGGRLLQRVHDRPEAAAGAVVLARRALGRLVRFEVSAARDESRQEPLERLLDLPAEQLPLASRVAGRFPEDPRHRTRNRGRRP